MGEGVDVCVGALVPVGDGLGVVVDPVGDGCAEPVGVAVLARMWARARRWRGVSLGATMTVAQAKNSDVDWRSTLTTRVAVTVTTVPAAMPRNGRVALRVPASICRHVAGQVLEHQVALSRPEESQVSIVCRAIADSARLARCRVSSGSLWWSPVRLPESSADHSGPHPRPARPAWGCSGGIQSLCRSKSYREMLFRASSSWSWRRESPGPPLRRP